MTDADAGTPTTYKMTMAQLRTSLLTASVGSGWGASDYLGLGSGTVPSSGMIRVGQGTLSGSSTPLINSTATWNNAGTTFTHILVNVTDTASNAASLFLDLQSSSSSKFSVTKTGMVGIGNAADASIGLWVRNATGGATSMYGGAFQPVAPSTTTLAVHGIIARASTAAAAFTVTNAYGVYIENAVKGAGSAITNVYGLYIEAPTGGASLSRAVHIAGGGLYVAGGTTELQALTATTGAFTNAADTNTVTAAPTHATYTGAAVRIVATRAASSAYYMIYADANSVAQFSVTGNGAVTAAGTTHNFGPGSTGTDAMLFNLDSGSGVGGAPVLQFMRGSSIKGILGVAGATNSIVGGSVANDVVLRANGTALLFTIDTGSTAAMRITTGNQVILDQAGNDGEILTLRSTDVAHGMTTLTDTSSYGTFNKESATDGGMQVVGWTEGSIGLHFLSNVTSEVSTRSTGVFGAVLINARLKSGTSAGAMSADRNILAVAHNGTSRFFLDTDGDSHQDVGTAWTNFDDHDDVARLNLLAAHVTRRDDPLRRSFNHWLQQDRSVLTQMRLVSFNADGHHFVNMSRLTMLHTGAIRQIGAQVKELRTKEEELRGVITELLEQNPFVIGRKKALAMLKAA